MRTTWKGPAMMMITTMMWAVLWAVLFAANLLNRWVDPAMADLQKQMLPAVEPWTEEKRRKYNRGVVLRAVIMASTFTFATWAVARSWTQVI